MYSVGTVAVRSLVDFSLVVRPWKSIQNVILATKSFGLCEIRGAPLLRVRASVCVYLQYK